MAKVVLNRPEVRTTATEFATPRVERVMEQTLTLARRYVPVRKGSRPFDRRPTGRLKRSLKKVGPRKLIGKVEGDVGSRLPYAASIHDTAKPHVIPARRRPNLVFYWDREDVTFVGKQVKHPGVRRRKRKQYLYLPLVIVGRRHGFIVRRLTASSVRSNLP